MLTLSTNYGGINLIKKKTIVKLACATMLMNTGMTIIPSFISTSQVQASTTSVASNALGIDVAS